MKGIILVAGRVTEVYWWDLGGSKEFLRGSGGLLGGLIYPEGAIFAALEVFYMTGRPKVVPNSTEWSNWPSFTGYASLTQFGIFGPL